MRYKEYGFALTGKASHNFHKFVDFLRCENRRRFVKYQNLVFSVQHFEDFDPLLHTNGNIFYLGIYIYFQTVALRKLHYLFSCFFFLEKAKFVRGFGAQNNIVKHCKHIHQLKMLMHHSDSKRCRVVWIVNLYNLSVLSYFARLRLIKSEQNAHKR